MTTQIPDFDTIRAWYENSLAELMFNVDRNSTKPEHLEAFSLLSSVFMLAIQVRDSDQLASNAQRLQTENALLLKYAHRQSLALERIAAALEAPFGKEASL